MASLSPSMAQSPASSNTPPSDESAMYELSFDYEQNSAGEWKRVSKGRSSPPTPVDKLSPPTDLFPLVSGNPSPPPSTRLSLTRSESLPGIPSTLSTDRPDPVPSAQSVLRSFQRTHSGPVSLPQSSLQPSHTPGQLFSSTHVRTILAGGLRSAGRITAGGPRRVTLEEFNQINEKLKVQQQEEQEAMDLHIQTANLAQDEKENHDGSALPPIDTAAVPNSIHRRYSPPRSASALSDAHYSYLSSRYSAVGTTSSSNTRSTLADVVPVPQRPSLPMLSTASSTRQLVAGPSRLSRVHSHGQKKFLPGLAIDKISEVDAADDGVYADPAAGSETDGGVEDQLYKRSQAPPTRQRVNALTRSATRPRRSASLSDASSAWPCMVDMKCSLTLTSAGTSRCTTYNDCGLAFWCPARDQYGSNQLPHRSGARNAGGKEAP
ncbi:hypothetical protein BC826DRAFT_666451 [Russula brevipes]|nr:hypothetical protein BC826DRAFT_666451 [Russula brevipes]